MVQPQVILKEQEQASNEVFGESAVSLSRQLKTAVPGVTKAIAPLLMISTPGTMELGSHTILRFFGSHQASIDMAGGDIILVMASLPLLLASLFSM